MATLLFLFILVRVLENSCAIGLSTKCRLIRGGILRLRLLELRSRLSAVIEPKVYVGGLACIPGFVYILAYS
jgi:hypothetical protein